MASRAKGPFIAVAVMACTACQTAHLALRPGDNRFSRVTFSDVQRHDVTLEVPFDNRALTCWTGSTGRPAGLGVASFEESWHVVRVCLRTEALREAHKKGTRPKEPARIEVWGVENSSGQMHQLHSPCSPSGSRLAVLESPLVPRPHVNLVREGERVRVEVDAVIGITGEVRSRHDDSLSFGRFWEERRVEGSFMVDPEPPITDRTGVACQEIYSPPAQGQFTATLNAAKSDTSTTIVVTEPPPEDSGNTLVDQDGDGVLDEVDPCPNRPEDVDGYQDLDGCPDEDDDQDGLLDAQDECPREPGPTYHAGCPHAGQDMDGDGIIDTADPCPELRGPLGTGCPKTVFVSRTADAIVLSQPIRFAENHAFIEGDDSTEVLNQIADILVSHPTVHLSIESVSTERGLATRRVQSIRGALIRRGVAAARLNVTVTAGSPSAVNYRIVSRPPLSGALDDE